MSAQRQGDIIEIGMTAHLNGVITVWGRHSHSLAPDHEVILIHATAEELPQGLMGELGDSVDRSPLDFLILIAQRLTEAGVGWDPLPGCPDEVREVYRDNFAGIMNAVIHRQIHAVTHGAVPYVGPVSPAPFPAMPPFRRQTAKRRKGKRRA